MNLIADFDGTLIRNNLGLALMRALSTNSSTTQYILNASHDEQTFENHINDAWKLIKTDSYALLLAIQTLCKHWSDAEDIRRFFATLNRHTITVVSNGILPYLKPCLPLNTDIICTPAYQHPAGGFLTFADFRLKEKVVTSFCPAIYLGDSSDTDLAPALSVLKNGGTVLTPKGSSLSNLLPTVLEYVNLEDAAYQILHLT